MTNFCFEQSFSAKSLFVDAGAEGMQDTGDVGLFLGSATKWLHHQPCLQLGGPSGSERLPAAGRAGRQPEEGGRCRREDGKNLFSIF